MGIGLEYILKALLRPYVLEKEKIQYASRNTTGKGISLNEGRLLEQIFWTVPKVGPCFILKALLFKEFAEISCS